MANEFLEIDYLVTPNYVLYLLQGSKAADKRFSLGVSRYSKMLQVNPVSLLSICDPCNEAEAQITAQKHWSSKGSSLNYVVLV